MWEELQSATGLIYSDTSSAILQGWWVTLLIGCTLQFIRMLVISFKNASSTDDLE